MGKYGSEYAYYTRWPSFKENGWPAEAEDLVCPECGAEELVWVEEPDWKSDDFLGHRMQCWICKYEFQVTENCWKLRKID